jgi:hypothetical protein
MKKLAQAAFIAGLLLSATALARAQDVAPTLTDVATALECQQQQAEQQQPSGWKRERVTPMTGSENVLIEMYVSAGRRVKVSITYHQSAAAAIKAMKSALHGRQAKTIPNLSDEAYSWGLSDSIALRKNNLIVYVSAVSDIDYLLPVLDTDQRNRLRHAEESALNKNFARVVAQVLSNLEKACESSERV